MSGTEEDAIDEILDNLGCPRKNPSVMKARAAIQSLLAEARKDELTRLHRSEGKDLPKRDYDNITDELIDERLEQLAALGGKSDE